MQRSTISLILGIDTQTLSYKEGYGDRLITLCSNVQHVNLLLIFGIDISSILHQQFDEIHISMKRSEVKSCEPFFALAMLVNPNFQSLLLLHLLIWCLVFLMLLENEVT
jgi:hypothetical protein